jgi:hypothetical protein
MWNDPENDRHLYGLDYVLAIFHLLYLKLSDRASRDSGNPAGYRDGNDELWEPRRSFFVYFL